MTFALLQALMIFHRVGRVWWLVKGRGRCRQCSQQWPPTGSLGSSPHEAPTKFIHRASGHQLFTREPKTARTVHVREIDECKPAFRHALPLGGLTGHYSALTAPASFAASPASLRRPSNLAGSLWGDMDRYSHVTDTMQADAATRLDLAYQVAKTRLKGQS